MATQAKVRMRESQTIPVKEKILSVNMRKRQCDERNNDSASIRESSLSERNLKKKHDFAVDEI